MCVSSTGIPLTQVLPSWDRAAVKSRPTNSANARAPYFLMQHSVKDMRKRKSPGAIVNILSVNIHCGLPTLAIYSRDDADGSYSHALDIA